MKMVSQKHRRAALWTFFYAILIFLIDQISKFYVVHFLNLVKLAKIEVIPGHFNLQMAWNQGINFGLFASNSNLLKIFLVSVAIIICVFLLIWTVRQTNPYAYLFSGIIIGGASGNVVDRILYGAVADFLNFSCCKIQNPYSFNVADIAIFLGAVSLIFLPNIHNDDERK